MGGQREQRGKSFTNRAFAQHLVLFALTWGAIRYATHVWRMQRLPSVPALRVAQRCRWRLPYAKKMQHRAKHAANQPEGGELSLIRYIRSRTAGGAIKSPALGIGDDCALIRPRAGQELAVTTDLTVCGRHFRLDWHTPESVGHRALARGLSDLAAMGARPVAAFLSLGLPREFARPGVGGWASSWVGRFLDGLLALAERHGTPLAGGDVSETPVPLADIVLMGSVPQGKAILRSTARPGDLLYVTGMLGGGAAALPHFERLSRGGINGLNAARISQRLAPLLVRHLYPEPRIAQGLVLRSKRLASAAMDMSDGLSSDLAHICEESGVAAEVEAALLPVHPGASVEYALHGGDDYELLFTARPGVRMPKAIGGVALTRIGRIVAKGRGRAAISVITERGTEPLLAEGWEHFR